MPIYRQKEQKLIGISMGKNQSETDSNLSIKQYEFLLKELRYTLEFRVRPETPESILVLSSITSLLTSWTQ
jgi:hypothetical protein